MPEDPRFEMNQYYGAWKINEEDNFINKNDHVRDGLDLLKKIGQKIPGKTYRKHAEKLLVSPHFLLLKEGLWYQNWLV